jgi:hypothetical protein
MCSFKTDINQVSISTPETVPNRGLDPPQRAAISNDQNAWQRAGKTDVPIHRFATMNRTVSKIGVWTCFEPVINVIPNPDTVTVRNSVDDQRTISVRRHRKCVLYESTYDNGKYKKYYDLRRLRWHRKNSRKLSLRAVVHVVTYQT